jgi:ABC-2 type transport system permease protein
MHNVLMVIRREYFERVRKVSFWVGVLLFPVIMGVMFVVPMLLFALKSEKPKTVAVVDATGRLAPALGTELQSQKLSDGRPEFRVENVPVGGDLDTTRKSLEPRVASKELFGILTVGNELDASGNYRLYARNVGDIVSTSALERSLQRAVVGLRLERSNLDVDRASLDRLTAKVEIESFQVTAGGEAKKKGFLEAYFGTMAFVVVLMISLLSYGIAMMRGILEEKASRIVEVLMGSLSADELMTGKIVGIGLVGLTQISLYVALALGLQVVAAAKPLGQGWTGLLDAIAPAKMIYFVVFFVLGYFLYTALYAAVGAVCNTEQEAQNFQAPVQWSLMLTMFSTFYFLKDPDSTLAVVVSLIPLFAPMVMFMRITLMNPPLWQIALSIVLLLLTLALLFKGVAKVFRIGILMYGKRPTVREVLRWARS